MTATRTLVTDQLAASCYFRTSVPTGQRIGAVDAEVCPVTTAQRRHLPVVGT